MLKTRGVMNKLAIGRTCMYANLFEATSESKATLKGIEQVRFFRGELFR